MTRSRTLGVTMAAALVAIAAVPAGAPAATPVITMSGSTSVAPLASLLARAYVKQYPGRVKFKLAQGGSDIGVADVASGRVTIGNSSRDPKPTDPGGIFFNRVAKDAICIATNPGNPVANWSQETIQGVFSGRITDWKDVPGSPISGPINLVVRTPAAGTDDAFRKIFMGSAAVSPNAAQKASNGLQASAVKSDKNAVAYLSMEFTRGLNVGAFKGVACNLRNAKSGEYGGVRNFWMVTRGRARGQVQRFINWAQTSRKAAKVTGTHWIPLI